MAEALMATRTCSTLAGTDWELTVTERPDGGVSVAADQIQIVLLWEVLQELKRLNALLHCHNFTELPRTLKRISRKIPDRSRKRGRPRKEPS